MSGNLPEIPNEQTSEDVSVLRDKPAPSPELGSDANKAAHHEKPSLNAPLACEPNDLAKQAKEKAHSVDSNRGHRSSFSPRRSEVSRRWWSLSDRVGSRDSAKKSKAKQQTHDWCRSLRDKRHRMHQKMQHANTSMKHFVTHCFHRPKQSDPPHKPRRTKCPMSKHRLMWKRPTRFQAAASKDLKTLPPFPPKAQPQKQRSCFHKVCCRHRKVDASKPIKSWKFVSKAELRSLYGIVLAGKARSLKEKTTWLSAVLELIRTYGDRQDPSDRIRESALRGDAIALCMKLLRSLSLGPNEGQTQTNTDKLSDVSSASQENDHTEQECPPLKPKLSRLQSLRLSAQRYLSQPKTSIKEMLDQTLKGKADPRADHVDCDDADCAQCSYILLKTILAVLQEICLTTEGNKTFLDVEGASQVAQSVHQVLGPQDDMARHWVGLESYASLFRLILTTGAADADSSQAWIDAGLVDSTARFLDQLKTHHQPELIPVIGLGLGVIGLLASKAKVKSASEALRYAELSMVFLRTYSTHPWIVENAFTVLAVMQLDYLEVTARLLELDPWKTFVHSCKALARHGEVLSQALRAIRHASLNASAQSKENREALRKALIDAKFEDVLGFVIPESGCFEQKRLFAAAVLLKYFLHPINTDQQRAQSFVRISEYRYIYDDIQVDHIPAIVTIQKTGSEPCSEKTNPECRAELCDNSKPSSDALANSDNSDCDPVPGHEAGRAVHDDDDKPQGHGVHSQGDIHPPDLGKDSSEDHTTQNMLVAAQKDAQGVHNDDIRGLSENVPDQTPASDEDHLEEGGATGKPALPIPDKTQSLQTLGPTAPTDPKHANASLQSLTSEDSAASSAEVDKEKMVKRERRKRKSHKSAGS